MFGLPPEHSAGCLMWKGIKIMINFIALVICFVAAIFQGTKGNIGWCITEIVLALCNLPFAIKWLKDF